ncbi:MAG TPA: DUF2268 domain-containing putative Zn-dependent protease [Longimicrobiaceae bacterium]|nr:DUF2268 domain-containing putative Zn-dependent protease [Longimicrobiaceae bacterium]
MRTTVLLLAAAILTALPGPSRAQAPALAGEWDGMMRSPRPTPLALTLSRGPGGWTGTISTPARNVAGRTIDTVRVSGDSVHLRFAGELRGLRLRAALADGGRALVGVATAGPNTMPFRLARPGTPEAAAMREAIAAPFDVSHAHPDSARIVAEDVARFWAAVDASTEADRAAVLQREYLDRGSPGLQDMTVLRIGSAESLVESMKRFPGYYRAARASTLRAAEFEPQIREAFRRMEALYPEAVYPDVYLLVGNLSTGGTTSGRGLLIGTEVYARNEQTPDEEMLPFMRASFRSVEALPEIVAHELVHYQQDYARGNTLLRQALVEGVADFVGELISGAHINPAAHAWADAHESGLWCEFREQMHGTDTSNWFYNGARATDRPADLGYNVGYRIARAYHERAADKRRAVRDMLKIQDFDAFLEASGYDARFTCPAAGS